jgi:hypothetical protein
VFSVHSPVYGSTLLYDAVCNTRVDHALIPFLWTSLDILFNGYLYDLMGTILVWPFGPGGGLSKASVLIP